VRPEAARSIRSKRLLLPMTPALALATRFGVVVTAKLCGGGVGMFWCEEAGATSFNRAFGRRHDDD
jgi:hypothetical protein